jgi:predicted TIM-barrel fold metal-dependent hydrolase
MLETVETTTEVDRSIPFIDTHHHLWDLGHFEYSWLKHPGDPNGTAVIGDYSLIRSTIGSPLRLFKEFYGSRVIRSVHVEAAYSGPDPVDETMWLDGVNREFGFPNALVIFCDLASQQLEADLERHLVASNLTRGVRLRAHPDDVDNPMFRKGYKTLAKYDLSYELNASPGKLISGRRLAVSVPDIQVILGHAGYPLYRSSDYFQVWCNEMAGLAEAPNVACKISGLGMADHRWTVESIRPWVLQCIELFGVDRTMFGTNWPVDGLYSTYLELTDAYRTILRDAGASRIDQELMLYRNAEKFYRLT